MKILVGGDILLLIFGVQQVVEVWCREPVSELEQSALKGRKVDCLQAEQWKKDSLGVAYKERVSLDLKTLKKSRSGNIRCAARE